jgi:ABC-type uncharacterized transport system substrate-binding protein
MHRREFLTLVGGAAVSWPFLAHAQPRLPRVGVLLFGPTLSPGDLQIAVELARLGYVDGRNITYVVRAAESDVNRMPLLARELVAAKPDVIIGQSSPIALALIGATHDIPIVMTVIRDPIALGLTSSISRPTRNVTGFIADSPSVAAKRLELLREIVPSLHKVAYLWVPENSTASSFGSSVQQAADTLGIRLVSFPLKSGSDIDNVFERAEQEKVTGVLVEADPLTLRLSSSIVDHCLLYGLPCMQGWAIETHNGALISYGPAAVQNNSRAAIYVDRILKGAKVTDLPFEEPTKFKLAINLKTAKTLGLRVPPNLLAIADEVTE